MNISDIDIQAISVTLKLSSLTVMILLFVSIPLAWWLAFTKNRYKVIVETLTALPLVLPPTVLGFYLLGVRSLWPLILIPPAITMASYYLFGTLLNVFLPSGSLF